MENTQNKTEPKTILEKNIITNIKEKVAKNHFIVGVGFDSIEQLHCCENNNCDLMLFYPTSQYKKVSNRFLTGYLAFDNTNKLMTEYSNDLQIFTNGASFFAAVNCSDPFKNDKLLLEHIKNSGFVGIHNYPSMSLIDGTFGANINYLKNGFDKELALFAKAKKYGLLTCAMIRTAKQAIQMLRVGVDVLVIYMGLGKKNTGSLSQFDEDIHLLNEITSAIRKISSDIPILFFGENIKTIREISYIKKEAPGINGYLLLPIAKQKVSIHQLEMEIQTLRNSDFV